MRYWLFTAFIFTSLHSQAVDSLIFIRQIPIQIKGQFCVDNMGNVYHYYKNELQKYDSLGTLKNKYSNNALGSISFVDVTNPLKILVFYRDNSAIVFLDNTLSEQGSSLSLQNVHIEFVPHACISQNEGFWIYDPQAFELKRFDDQLKLLFSSGNLYQITKESINPDFFMERHNKMLVQDADLGFFIFDVSGNFIQKITCSSCRLMEYAEPFLWYHQDNQVFVYNILTFEKTNLVALTSVPYFFTQDVLYQYESESKTIKLFQIY